MTLCISLHTASNFPPVVLQTVRECYQILNIKNLPIPRFKIANHLHVKWNGLCHHRSKETNTTITLQKRVLVDDRTCARIVAHEVIHHIQFLKDQDDSHGPIFESYAQKINEVMGSGFVTKESDLDYITSDTRAFYILIYKAENGYVWQTAVRLTKDMSWRVKAAKLHYNCKFFKTRDRKLWRTRANLGIAGNYHISTNSNIQQALKSLYDSAKLWWETTSA